MLTKNEAVRGLAGTTVDLGILRICYRFYKGVPVIFMFLDVILKAKEDIRVASLSLAFGLRMARRSDGVINTKQDA